jgi:hypothetical protein
MAFVFGNRVWILSNSDFATLCVYHTAQNERLTPMRNTSKKLLPLNPSKQILSDVADHMVPMLAYNFELGRRIFSTVVPSFLPARRANFRELRRKASPTPFDCSIVYGMYIRALEVFRLVLLGLSYRYLSSAFQMFTSLRFNHGLQYTAPQQTYGFPLRGHFAFLIHIPSTAPLPVAL